MGIEKIDHLWENGEYLLYRDAGKPNPKATTRIYSVRSRHNGLTLGTVKWYAQWRQYTFCPAVGTTFDAKCLTELAEYCKIKTAEHKGTPLSNNLLTGSDTVV